MVLKKCVAGCLVLLLLLQAGCAAAPSTANESSENTQSSEDLPNSTEKDGVTDDTLYQIRIGQDLTLVFDANGKEIPPERQFTVLYDEITGQPQCQKRMLSEDSGKDNEHGQPILYKTTALYDMSGNLLRDFEECDYKGGFGDFLIRQDPLGFVVEASDIPDDYHSELWNYKTDATVLDGVANASLMNDEGSKILMTDAHGHLLGVTDRDGAVISGFPTPKSYYNSSACNNRIITYNQAFDDVESGRKTTMSLLREDLSLVFSCESLFGEFQGLRGDYLFFREGDRSGILDLEGKEIYTISGEEGLDYFDGELAVLSNRTTENGQESNFSRSLVTVDGTVLAAGYDIIQDFEDIDKSAPAKSFIGVRGEVADLIARDGTVTASKEFPGITAVYPIGNGLFQYQTELNGDGLFNESLELLLEPGIYTWIQPLSSWQNGTQKNYDLLQCAYYINDGSQSGRATMRFDLLDLSLNKILTGLTQISDVGPNRIAVVRGFSAGLIDFEGNWIVKKSIFQNLNDDYNEWGAF